MSISHSHFVGLAVLVLAQAAAMTSAAAPLQPSDAPTAASLRCEYLTNPLGVDDPAPRLSWTLSSDQRGSRQTAYEVQVASTPERLEAGDADVWATGKVASDRQYGIEYAGKPLASRQRCHWRVRVWGADGGEGPWSATASWEVGLRDPADWQAKWIEEGKVLPAAKLDLRYASYESTNRKSQKDVLAKLKDHMSGGRLDFTVDNATLGGDPSPGNKKQLTVRYTLDGGPEMTEIFREASHVWMPTLAPQELRRTFAVDKPIARARLYATALGQYELRINGKPVTDTTFNPNWTDYRTRVRYQAYDVTSLLREGKNAIGGSIANGFFSGHIANSNFQFYGLRPALLAQLELTYADGSVDRVGTDERWRRRAGAIQATDIMLGEDYDARRAVDGSDPELVEDGEWKAVAVRTTELPKQVSDQVAEPIRELMTLPAKAVTEPQPTRWVFDFGQNMVGIPRLKVEAPAGTRVTVRFAEMLKPDGTLYTSNYRAATSIDSYVCRGGGVETWQPRFTYHGFRYVELTGLPGKPSLDAVTGVVLGSDTPSTGTFTSSDDRINKLWSNIRWGQRGNFFGVPTDCPQRDERLGWLGDAQVFIGTAVYNADVAAFFTKWHVDIADEQLPDGRFKSTAPDTDLVQAGVPGWADAGVICPWTIYQTYGDTRQLARQLPTMKRFVDWCEAEGSTDLIRDKARGNDFGDWLSIGADTDKELLGTAYFARSTDLVARSCKALGDEAGAAKYGALFERIKAAFRARYVRADGTIGNGTQTCYALALAFELLPDGERAAAAKRLADDVAAKGGHLSTGFLGVSYLLPALTDHGQADVAYRLLMQDTFPSWLFSIKHGATTIWERWDGWTPEKGFQRPGMNSLNHYSLGSCGQWMYERVAGVAQPKGGVGFAHVEVRPLVDGPLTSVAADYVSPRGPVRVAWERKGGTLTLDVTVPPNVTATVHVPTTDPAAVTESGELAAKAEGVRQVTLAPDAAVFEIGSGTYHFSGALGR